MSLKRRPSHNAVLNYRRCTCEILCVNANGMSIRRARNKSTQQGELKQAEKMLHLALRIAQQTQNADGITYVYDLLANVALENGELEKSEKLFVTVMQRLLSTGAPQDDNRVLHMSLKLAEIYTAQKLDGGDKDEDTLLLMSLAAEGHSKLVANQGKHQEARILMQKALDCSQESGGDSEERLAALMSDLGALCTMCGDDEAALKHLHQAVLIGRKTDTDNLPAFLVNLGLLSLSKGLKSDAQSACKEAWDLSRARKNQQYESEAMFCLNEIKK
ncbi:hypothetical protein B566_EDAN019073 [Ephemera danica]|nr:hypothetical protein B566_EDAN019073 [Ephemera danica]